MKLVLLSCVALAVFCGCASVVESATIYRNGREVQQPIQIEAIIKEAAQEAIKDLPATPLGSAAVSDDVAVDAGRNEAIAIDTIAVVSDKVDDASEPQLVQVADAAESVVRSGVLLPVAEQTGEPHQVKKTELIAIAEPIEKKIDVTHPANSENAQDDTAAEPAIAIANYPIHPASLAKNEVPVIVIDDRYVESESEKQDNIPAASLKEEINEASTSTTTTTTTARPNIFQQALAPIQNFIENNPITQALNSIRPSSAVVTSAPIETNSGEVTTRPNLVQQFQAGIQNFQNQIQTAFNPSASNAAGTPSNDPILPDEGVNEAAGADAATTTTTTVRPNLIQNIQNAVGSVFNRPQTDASSATQPAATNPLQAVIQNVQNIFSGNRGDAAKPATAATPTAAAPASSSNGDIVVGEDSGEAKTAAEPLALLPVRSIDPAVEGGDHVAVKTIKEAIVDDVPLEKETV